MKKIIAGLVMILAIVSAGSLAAQEIKCPTIMAKEINFDFGSVQQGTLASHVFEISNTGGEILIIDHVQSS
jgi:hypothetical protein